MTATLRIDSSLSGAGTNDRSRSDIAVAETVTVRSVGAGTAHSFRLLWRPTASSSVLVADTSTSMTIVPDAVGPYRIELTVDDEITKHTFTVLTTRLSLGFPAFNEIAAANANLAEIGANPDWIKASETNEGGTYEGWALVVEDAILKLDESLTTASAEFNAESPKGAPIGADILLIEDSAVSWSKAKITLATIPGTSDILDDSYNNDSGTRIITVDDGDLRLECTGAYSFEVDLDQISGTSDGFTVSNGSDDFSLLYKAASKIDLIATLQNITFNSDNPITISNITRQIIINAANMPITGGAPSGSGSSTFFGMEFDADAEEVTLAFDIPYDWNGTSNMFLKILWYSTPTGPLSDTETVKWDITYRSIAVGENIDNGSVQTNTITHTQSGAGGDPEYYETSMEIVRVGGNQTITTGDTLSMLFNRDMTGDTYGLSAFVAKVILEYTANTI